MPVNRGGQVPSSEEVDIGLSTLPSTEFSLTPTRRMERGCCKDVQSPTRFTLTILFVILILISLVCVIVVFLEIGGAINMGPPCESSKAEHSISDVILENDGVFGKTTDGKSIESFTFKNKNKMEVTVLTYGGTISRILVPDREGNLDDVTLGFDTLADYEGSNNPYFGCIVGRYANRIGGGTFSIDGVTYNTPKNDGDNSLHGGIEGFNKKVWDAKMDDDTLVLTYVSVDGEEGFPGQLTTQVTYKLTNQNEIVITFEATTTQATPISLTNHAYFNLAIRDSNVPTIYDHQVSINAARYTPVDSGLMGLIPTGELATVSGTLFDLKTSTMLSERINDIPGGGYDHNFCINGPTGRKVAARVEHAASGRVLEVFTNQPGMQFYTGNFLGGFAGKSGANYTRHTGFAMEPQTYPDSPNKANFPDAILHPGSTYNHEMTYKFSVKA
ncbi:unnamed protein product [Owenia fusiformis]|uniref:Galactose mutarotase n=1 Tax=Owenia fusiformis TaxID=6347 RepID=A0A8S4NQR5_OWEFU|nr:unnamed protein product [Owenia fusiformis]